MNVIFLDHDGVICLDEQFGSRSTKRIKEGYKSSMLTREYPLHLRFDDFDPECVHALNIILDKTDAEIVVSSDWRFFATLEEMGRYYECQGINKKPIDFTPSYKNIPKRDGYDPMPLLERIRIFEIREWLRENSDKVINWVAVDDLNMGEMHKTEMGMLKSDLALENFVMTEWEGIKTENVINNVIAYLLGEKND